MENSVLMQRWTDDVENISINSMIDCLRSIELNLSNICNFRCPFCPQHFGWKDYNTKFLLLKDVEIIYQYLKEINYQGYICTAGFGEPTLNPEFKSIIKRLSEFKIVIVSNGTQYTNEEWKEIENYGKSVQIKISVHEWDKINEYKEKFKDTNAWYRNHDMKNPQMNLYNRAGYLDMPKVQKTTRCNYPFYKIFIDSDGSYLQCEADWNHLSKSEYNIYNTSIKDYYETILEEKRNLMMTEKGRQHFSCCKYCDINGMMIGNNFVEYWNDNKRKL